MRRLSIEVELPLLITSLLVLVIGSFSWAAYSAVQRSTIVAAEERLDRVSSELAGNLSAGGPQRRRDVEAAAAQEALAIYLGQPGPSAGAAARRALAQPPSRDTLNASVELWGVTGERLLAAGRPLPTLDTGAARQIARSATSPSGGAVGPLRSVGDSLFFPAVAPIVVAGRTRGYVVIWRRVLTSARSLRQVTALIGSDASLLLGNRQGDLWTDLVHRVDAPPVDVSGGGHVAYERPGRGWWMARAEPLAGTPWILVIEFSRDRVLAPARSLLGRIAAVAILLIAAGAVGAWLVSRRITTPLGQLTLAAERLRQGDTAARTGLQGGSDEVGRLSGAFDAMAVALAEHDTVVQRADRALRASEAKFASAFMAHPSAMVIASLGDARYLEVNESFVRLTGFTRDQAIGRTGDELGLWQDTQQRRELLAALRAGRGFRDVEVEWGIRSGERRTGLLSAELIEVDSTPHCLVHFHDITERRLLEHQLLQAQKMEAVGRLAGGIAHDFNNVLTAIFGYADLLAEELPPDHAGRGDLSEIRTAATRAATLTRQLLAFSRQQVLQPVVLNLNDVVASVEKMLLRVLGEDVDMRTVLAKDLANTRADAGQLEQVLLNLVVNARDAMPTGGKLTIETANVELDEQYAEAHRPVVPGRYVMLAVSDTGVGMNGTTRARIFEPFFTTKEKGKGTGLGLATVYGIVKQSGGYIWVYSEPAQGATFKVYLPRVDAPVEGAAVAVEVAAGLRGTETILLAEDDPLLLPLARDVLRRQGYTVLEAHTPAEAAAVAAGHPAEIHLLVSDVVMPGESGLQLARRLLATRPQLRVLYISGYSDEAVVRHGLLDPGTTFLQKPFTPAALARKVRDVLDAAS